MVKLSNFSELKYSDTAVIFRAEHQLALKNVILFSLFMMLETILYHIFVDGGWTLYFFTQVVPLILLLFVWIHKLTALTEGLFIPSST